MSKIEHFCRKVTNLASCCDLEFLKPKKAIGREGCVKEAAAGQDTLRRFEIETVLASNLYSVLFGQYERHFMLLTVYDPDIAVFAERRLHDGNANAVNSGIAVGDNETIEYHCFVSKAYGKDAAE